MNVHQNKEEIIIDQERKWACNSGLRLTRSGSNPQGKTWSAFEYVNKPQRETASHNTKNYQLRKNEVKTVKSIHYKAGLRLRVFFTRSGSSFFLTFGSGIRIYPGILPLMKKGWGWILLGWSGTFGDRTLIFLLLLFVVSVVLYATR